MRPLVATEDRSSKMAATQTTQETKAFESSLPRNATITPESSYSGEHDRGAEESEDGGVSSASTEPRRVEEPIRHRLEYFSIVSEQSVYFEGKDDEEDSDIEPPVLEHVEVRLTNEKINPDNITESTRTKFHEIGTGNAYIVVLSPVVCEALRCVVDYCPGIDLSRKNIRINYPYSMFVFYEDELTQYRERLEEDSEHEPGATCPNRNAARNIKIVQDFVKREVGDKVDAERERHSRGYATFDMMWLLYKPGIDVYHDTDLTGEHDPFIIQDVQSHFRESSVFRYLFQFWNMNADSEWVGPAQETSYEYRFAGEKAIASLRTYPCEYLQFSEGITDQDIIDIKSHFIQRGKKWWNLRREKNCHSFDGTTVRLPRRSFNSLVMVDPIQYVAENPERIRLMDSVAHPFSPLKLCACDWCKEKIYSHAVKPRFVGYSDINPYTTEELTDHQYFLCDRMVEAFLFKTRKWELLHISGFKKASFDKTLIDRLVMKESTKDLIKSLTRTYVRSEPGSLNTRPNMFHKITTVHKEKEKKKQNTTWSADFIEGKGEGVTFLLHGKPGVGKTYTAECIADFTERPLLCLTCSDVGSEPEAIEDNLLKWSKLAESWGAIMLIDEADIYMEQRQVQDLKRNHLVAGFLRALEYFKGILFLTTNRVGTFDEAFISRIHVQLYYQEFRDDDRDQVWDNFFQKLEDDRETTMRIPQATKDYAQSQELRALKWNGREIRNAFQVAVALAEAQGHKDTKGRILIKKEHLKATVQMSREFKDYLLKVRKQDESKRAAILGYRYDAYEPSSSTEKPKEAVERY